MAQCCGHFFPAEEPCSPRRVPAKIMAAVRVPPATEEVIHCLQSQGSPAATSQSCKLNPGDTSNLGGPLRAAPFFASMSKTRFSILNSYWRAARRPRYSLSFALPLLAAYEVLAF